MLRLTRIPIAFSIARSGTKLCCRLQHDAAKKAKSRQTGNRNIYISEIFISSLLTHEKLYNTLNVRCSFVVPTGDDQWPSATWGYSLGRSAAYLRASQSRISKTDMKMLEGLGFIWNIRDHKFSLIKKALELYKNQYGDVLVPKMFVIPDDLKVWPIKELHGLKLGNSVQLIRHKGSYADKWQELNKLGFVYDLMRRPSPPFGDLLNALRQYKAIHGNLTVPYAYVVPKDSSWDEKYHGLALGILCGRIRRRSDNIFDSPEEQFALQRIGFEEFTPRKDKRGFPVILKALKAYKKRYGDLAVPVKFIVPRDDDDDPDDFPTDSKYDWGEDDKYDWGEDEEEKEEEGLWPPSTRGMRLGQICNDIRNEGAFGEHIPELEAIGFLFDGRRTNYSIESILAAIRCYKEKFGNTSVPQKYIVPSDSDTWPKTTWDLPLGFLVSHIRNNDAYADKRKELEEAGFDYRPQRDTRGFEPFTEALKVYKKLHGHVFVPYSFIVPANSKEWPEELWEMQLGSRVRNMRCRAENAQKREVLKEMGIDLDEKKGK